jgi:cytochrome c556
MKLVLVLLFTAFAAFAAIPDTSEADLEAAMKKVLPAQGGLRKAIEAKDAEAVKKEAATLEAVFATSEAFFKERKIEDATNWSAQAKTGAAQIAKLAAAGEWDKIPDAQKQVGSTCAACHTAHREKLPEGGYKIK